MTRLVIFGNSGSGKSTLAKYQAEQLQLAHLDLDTIAWLPTSPPTRKSLADSKQILDEFINCNDNWVIEGCYSDLIELVLPITSQLVFLDLSVNQCVQNAQNRKWEPHKYETPEAQDANLAMLIDWIKQYDSRTDTFSKQAHTRLFDQFSGSKQRFTQNPPLSR